MADGFAAPQTFKGEFTPEIEAQTAPIWEKVKHHVTPMEWRVQAPLIVEINRLKREKNAAIL
ncbi:MAG: quinolinate synthase NadA, partial [Caulobacter sp.]